MRCENARTRGEASVVLNTDRCGLERVLLCKAWLSCRRAYWFELLERMSMQQRRFVDRMAHDRAAERGGPRVSEVLADACVVTTREVQLSERDERADQHRGGGTSPRRCIPSALDDRRVFFRKENHCATKLCSSHSPQNVCSAVLIMIARRPMPAKPTPPT